ncbi:MAG: hypothetical protein GX133_04835 [Syntrophomonadaceae bacterium]|nr:hypothetical protein [Syntrophomonadaceae bacterium]
MHIISNHGYVNLVFIVIMMGAMMEVIWRLSKQMKNTGKWSVDYDNFAVNIVVSMIIMCVFTRALRDSLEALAFVIIWLLLPCYLLLRNLKKS